MINNFAREEVNFRVGLSRRKSGEEK